MSCTITQNVIGEGTEATVQFQLLDHRNVPWTGTEFDSVLFTLHNADDAIINGQEDVEVFGEDVFDFIASYSATVISVNRQAAILETEVSHDMYDAYVGMLSGLDNGDLPPNGVPMAYSAVGPTRVAVPRGRWDDWDVVGLSGTLAVGIVRLSLSTDDTAITTPGPPDGQVQDRWALLKFYLSGQLVKAESIKFGVRNQPVLA